MTDPTVYQQLKRLAAPVVKYYHTDLTEHDLRICQALQRNDVLIWAPREHGTCAVIIRHDAEKPLDALRLSLEVFDAYVSSMHPPQWYWTTCHADRRGTIRKVTPEKVRSYFAGRVASAEAAQARRH